MLTVNGGHLDFQMYRGGRVSGIIASSQTDPDRPLSSFHTHTRRQPVTQSPRSRRSYGKIEDCEESRGRTVTICNKIAAFFVVLAAGL